ncbi:EKC/KEOPS complex subunit Tprkb [Cryptosporidium felis]|nr:EKC/KEOPS complex subunit Tprkb [Cryptosporidium felis]
MNSLGTKLQRFTLGELLGEEFISVCLVRNISNSKELLQIVLDKSKTHFGGLVKDEYKQHVVVMNAKMIYSLEHILTSVSTCLLRRTLQGKPKTRTFETEVLYNMSPSTNAFGITETTKDAVCLFVNIDDELEVYKFLSLIKGQVDRIDNLVEVHELSEINKMIGLSKIDSQIGLNINDILRGQISIKDV